MAMLSVIIAGRREEFFSRTVEDALAAMRGDTEVICIADEGWPGPPIKDHPKVHIVMHPEAIGQRAAINEGVRLSRAKYVMKADAHCSFDEGFDVKMMQPYEDGEIDQRTTATPQMKNLFAFEHVCRQCKSRVYQGAKPTVCEKCKAKDSFEREMVWKPRHTKTTDFMRFDSEMHFAYFGEYKSRPAAQGDIADQMCCVGACWMLPKTFYEEIGGMDEEHGSWGQMGVELACKSWLSGGRQVVNKRTWFAHMFRTQPGFGFPYPISGNQVDHARKHSRHLWMDNTWPQQVRPLSWLIEKFAPVPSWDAEKIAAVSGGGRFGPVVPRADPPTVRPQARPQGSASETPGIPQKRPPIVLPARRAPTKGLLYYTHGEGDARVLAACRRTLTRAMAVHGIDRLVSVSLAPLDFGDNIVLPFQKGILTMFKQQLRGLEALSDVDIVFFVEHDVLYHPDHFAFTPPRADVFYYDEHVWKIDAQDQHLPLFYFAKQTAELCAHRDLLLGHYQKRVAKVEADGFSRHMGFEPGCHMPPRGVDSFPAMRWMSDAPQLDVRRTGTNLTKSRFAQEEFRSKNSCLGWEFSEEIPGWPRVAGRFDAFIQDVASEA